MGEENYERRRAFARADQRGRALRRERALMIEGIIAERRVSDWTCDYCGKELPETCFFRDWGNEYGLMCNRTCATRWEDDRVLGGL